MKYLVTGKNGQLARAFIRRLEERAEDFLALDRHELDIADPGMVSNVFSFFRPEVVLNCAAYNLVDRAEEEPSRAFEVNASGPGILANAAREADALMVHFSTDYVFDGARRGEGPYTEADAPNPLSEYGRSKLAGERAVQEAAGRFLVFRVSWVFGEGKQNFIYKLVDWAEKNEVLRIADDEISVPTYTYTIAGAVLKAVEKELCGLYHLTGGGSCSRYEWAGLVLKTLGTKKTMNPVPMSTFKLPARRPGFSAMSNKAISGELGIRIPAWEEDVQLFLKERFGR